MEPVELTIEGMTCEHCVRAVRQRLERTPGVSVNSVAVGSASIRMDASKVSLDDVEEAIADEGYTAFVAEK